MSWSDRYTNPARRAIFFAWMVGFASDRHHVTSVDMLAGLMWDDDSRAQTMFRLREYFPLYLGYPWKYERLPERRTPPDFERETTRILECTRIEANRMGDYWIETEHLLLGILRTKHCTAAQYLKMIGLTLDGARNIVGENRSSRPDYGPPARLWKMQSRAMSLISSFWP